jgi:hypothetical protein
MNEAFDWTLKIKNLLRRFDDVLLHTVQEWKSFSSPNEDIAFFSPTPEAAISSDARQSLHSIKTTFRQFEQLQRDLDILNKNCSDYLNAVSSDDVVCTH